MKSKYGNRKVALDGMKFDSAHEANRYQQLKLLERAGRIANLRSQVPFELIPAQRVDGKVVERNVKYIADFTYTKDGRLIVEDAKGFRTAEYKLKRKLMLYFHGIRIQEV